MAVSGSQKRAIRRTVRASAIVLAVAAALLALLALVDAIAGGVPGALLLVALLPLAAWGGFAARSYLAAAAIPFALFGGWLSLGAIDALTGECDECFSDAPATFGAITLLFGTAAGFGAHAGVSRRRSRRSRSDRSTTADAPIGVDATPGITPSAPGRVMADGGVGVNKRRALEALVAAWDTLDAARARAILSIDYAHHRGMTALSLEEALTTIRATRGPLLNPMSRVEQWLESDILACARVVTRAAHRSGLSAGLAQPDIPVEFSSIVIVRFDGPLIVECWEDADWEGIRRQILGSERVTLKE